MSVRIIFVFVFLCFVFVEATRLPLSSTGRVGYWNVLARSDGGSTENKRSSNGLQFMITNKMRSTLKEDLGYYDDEIDNMEPQIAAVVIEKSLNRPKKGMPASWRQNGGGLSKAWFKFGLRSKLNSLRKRVQRGIVAASGFLVEQSQRPLVRSALLVVALAAVRKPIMQSATTALQRVFEQLERLTSGQQRVSAYQLTPQYNKRSLLSVLEGQQQQEHWQQKRWWQLWRANAASSGSSGREGTRKKRAIDVDALSRVQHQGWWDKLRLKVAHWKRGW